MKILAAVALALLVAGCGKRDGPRVIVDEAFEIPQKQFAAKKFTLDLGGTYELTISPTGGNLEAWVQAGEARPMIVYNDKEAMPQAKLFSDGKQDTVSGALGWGGAHVIIFNRTAAPVRLKCKLTVVPTPVK
jgi:hypothetical protein